MAGYLALLLHAHLPFVRHPEHERFLEEHWLFEAVAECYLPLLRVLRGWQTDGIPGTLTLTLTPSLCCMLRDPLLQHRCTRYLQDRIELAKLEVVRTRWEPQFRPLANHYLEHFEGLRQLWESLEQDLVQAFRGFQDCGRIEIITCAATHALLPLMTAQAGCVRAQILHGRDHYAECFGRLPMGIWLPECAYTPELEPVLQEANLRWFVLDTLGVTEASPRPVYGAYAPLYTRHGLAAFGRDADSAQQVWSRRGGYPGDPRYRDFYRDIGFDLELGYLDPFLPSPGQRGFTGVKYYAVSRCEGQQAYVPEEAKQAVQTHAAHFLQSRKRLLGPVAAAMDRPPLLMAPYDAELFGHWWFEGPEFLDQVFRMASGIAPDLKWITPTQYLRLHPSNQVAQPRTSSWGEGGYWEVWLNPKNGWMQRHLRQAEQRMASLVTEAETLDAAAHSALEQAGRELMLAQSSDWAFILHTGTSTQYATQRFQTHLQRFGTLCDQIESGQAFRALSGNESPYGAFLPEVNWRHWQTPPSSGATR
jgi:1,4-alpha-glucan branching enzyme